MKNKTSTSLKIATLTGALIASIALPLSMGANAALDSGTFTVKAQDHKDPTIVAFAGIDPRGSGPSEGGDETGISRTFSCGDESLVITAAMQEFSDVNKALKDAGRAEEMTAYPSGGWKIIVESDTAFPGFNTVFLTVDGQAENTSLWNDSGPTAIGSAGGETCLASWNDGSLTRSIIEVQGIMEREVYVDTVSSKPHRTDGPATQTYYPNGNPYHVIYSINGKKHREDGPALIGYGELGEIQSIEWAVAGKQITTREAWIETVGEEGGTIWDSYDR